LNKRLISVIVLWAVLSVAACGERLDTTPAREILQVMQTAEAGWNAGDLEQYMACYRQSDRLRFAGGDRVSFGWHQVLANYRRSYPDRATMGTLTFSEMDVTMLAPDAAIVFGRWQLARETDATAADQPRGLFTLVFRREDGDWRIVHDHTSSAG